MGRSACLSNTFKCYCLERDNSRLSLRPNSAFLLPAKPPVSCTDMDCDYSSASSDHGEISDDCAVDSSDATGEQESDFCTTLCACGRVIGLNLYV